LATGSETLDIWETNPEGSDRGMTHAGCLNPDGVNRLPQFLLAYSQESWGPEPSDGWGLPDSMAGSSFVLFCVAPVMGTALERLDG
jgi:hypothetical protein